MQINVSEIMLNSIKSTAYPFMSYALGVVLLLMVISIFKYIELAKSGILEIDRMSGEEFELKLKILFEKLGYQVKHVGNSKGDYGVDLVIEKDGTKTAVQGKCYKKWHVGEDAVREVLAGKSVYECSQGWVITNSHFTYMAKKLAIANQIKLIDRWELIKLLKV